MMHLDYMEECPACNGRGITPRGPLAGNDCTFCYVGFVLNTSGRILAELIKRENTEVQP